MHFYSGPPMHFFSGVDTHRTDNDDNVSRGETQPFSIGRSSAPALGGRRSYPNSRPLPGSAGLAVVSLLHFAEHLVQVKAGGFLALRVLPEGLQKFPDKGLRGHQ